MNVIIERFAYSPLGTFGVLKTDSGFTCYTVERPWLNNQNRISCVPEGEYTLVWHQSPKFNRNLFALVGPTVSADPDPYKQRSDVLIHPANVMADLEGCIGLGDTLGYVKNNWAVLNSVITINNFYSLFSTSDTNISLTIKQIAGAV